MDGNYNKTKKMVLGKLCGMTGWESVVIVETMVTPFLNTSVFQVLKITSIQLNDIDIEYLSNFMRTVCTCTYKVLGIFLMYVQLIHNGKGEYLVSIGKLIASAGPTFFLLLCVKANVITDVCKRRQHTCIQRCKKPWTTHTCRCKKPLISLCYLFVRAYPS